MEIESYLQKAINKIEETQTKLIKLLVNEESISISNREYMDCYNFLFNIYITKRTQAKEDEAVFTWFSSQMENYLRDNFQKRISHLEGVEFLEQLREQWNKLQLYIFWLKFIFEKFDQSYQGLHKISLVGRVFTLLKNIIFNGNKEKILAIVFEFLNNHRDDMLVPYSLVIKIIQYFVELGFGEQVDLQKKQDAQGFISFIYLGTKQKRVLSYYQMNFEIDLFKNAKDYWSAKRISWLEVYSVPEYVKNAKLALQKESERAKACFQWSYQKYIDVCEEEIIQNSAAELVQNQFSGIASLISQDRFTDISELYTLLNRRREHTIPILSQELQEYVDKVGTEINNNENCNKDPREYIREVRVFYKKINTIIQELLGKEQEIQIARDKAFQKFINKFEKSVFFLAKHCDFELKAGMRGNYESEIEEKLADIIDIFLCLNNRDSFIIHYQKFLAIRLLHGTSLSDDIEKKLITLIKKEMGKSMTNKLTEMCTDLSVSQETMNQIKKQMKEMDLKKCESVEWKITILASGHWQIQNDNLDIPAELTWISDTYLQLYKLKNRGRKIDWAFSQGTAEIQSRFDKKYNLEVSNYQMIILLLFNNCNSYTFNQLSSAIKISINELHVQLAALCKSKLLLRSSGKENTEFEEEENVSVNLAFTNKLIKIKLQPSPELRKSIKSNDKTQEIAENEIEGELKKMREYQLDACIVRVMKSRRKLALNELNVEVIKIMGHIFKPQPLQIKHRVESLLERDYMARDLDDRAYFIYTP